MIRKEKIKYLKQIINMYKTIKDEELDGNKFLKIINHRFTLNNGKIINREELRKFGSNGSAAIILPITSNNEVLVAIEPRVFTKRTVGVGFPAGYIENDENPIQAAKRELLEETGFSSEDFIYVGSFYQDQGCSKAYNYYFIALNCEKKDNQKLDKDEYISYMLFNYNEIEELINNKYICGLNSAYLYEKSKTYIKK